MEEANILHHVWQVSVNISSVNTSLLAKEDLQLHRSVRFGRIQTHTHFHAGNRVGSTPILGIVSGFKIQVSQAITTFETSISNVSVAQGFAIDSKEIACGSRLNISGRIDKSRSTTNIKSVSIKSFHKRAITRGEEPYTPKKMDTQLLSFIPSISSLANLRIRRPRRRTCWSVKYIVQSEMLSGCNELQIVSVVRGPLCWDVPGQLQIFYDDLTGSLVLVLR